MGEIRDAPVEVVAFHGQALEEFRVALPSMTQGVSSAMALLLSPAAYSWRMRWIRSTAVSA